MEYSQTQIASLFIFIDTENLLKQSKYNLHQFKVNNRNIRKRCEICSRHRNDIDVVLLSFLLLTLNRLIHCSDIFIVDFQQVNVVWVDCGRLRIVLHITGRVLSSGITSKYAITF